MVRADDGERPGQVSDLDRLRTETVARPGTLSTRNRVALWGLGCGVHGLLKC
jgi:hypothetical protein